MQGDGEALRAPSEVGIALVDGVGDPALGETLGK